MTGAYRRYSRARSTRWTPSPTRRSALPCSAPRSTRFPTGRRCARSSGGYSARGRSPTRPRCCAPSIPNGREARPRGRYIHYDYGVSGVQDMLTSWIPLMEIPVQIGGLAVQPGGHLGPPRRPRPLSATEPGWATTSYEPGDVIIFHCLTPHAALPNRGSTLRISGDFRWQRPDQPAPAELVLGPAGRPPEMFSRAVPPRAVVGARARRAHPPPQGADDHRSRRAPHA